MRRVAVIRFPGSNCEVDTVRAVARAGGTAVVVDHRATELGAVDGILLPGGFSYGDYLRAGAIARFSPVMPAVQAFAAAGGPVLGICNGFQVLCEAHLLPGALMRNAQLHFVSKPVDVTVERTATLFTACYAPGQRLRLPVAHGEGRYVANDETLRLLEAEGRVVLRYLPAGGSAEGNPNGSTNDIAGISNAAGNVVGIMPHPERLVPGISGGHDGEGFFAWIAQGATAVAP